MARMAERQPSGWIVAAALLLMGPWPCSLASATSPQDLPLPGGAELRLGEAPFRHPGPIRSLEFSTDGSSLLAAGGGELRVWAVPGGTLLRSLPVGDAVRSSAVFSAVDGEFLLLGRDNTFRRVRARTGEEARRYPATESPAASAAFSPRRDRLAVMDQHGRLSVFDTASVEPVARFQVSTHVGAPLTFVGDGRRVAVASDEGVALWTLEGKPERQGLFRAGNICALGASEDGKLLAVGTWGNRVDVWDVSSDKRLQELKYVGSHVNCLAFFPDGTRLVVGARHPEIWDVRSGERRMALDGHRDFVDSVAVSRDGKRIASADRDGLILLWDAETGRRLEGSRSGTGSVLSLTLSPSGRELAAACNDQVLRVWDLAASTLRREIAGHQGAVLGAAYAPEGSRLATCSLDGTLGWWECDTGRLLWRTPPMEHRPAVWSLALHPREPWVAGTLLSGIKVWNWRDGRIVHAVEGLPEPGRWLRFERDGSLVCGLQDGTFRSWSPDLTRSTALLGEKTFAAGAPAVSVDGKFVATSCAFGRVFLWEAATGKPLLTVSEHAESFGQPLAFSPDGRRLAVAGIQGRIRIWEPGKERETLTLETPSNRARSIAFSADGSRLFAGMADGTILAWTMPALPRSSDPFEDPEALWHDLASPDPATACRAAHRLVSAPGPALKEIRSRAQPVEPGEVRKLIQDLDSTEPTVRENASFALADLAPSPALLREAFAASPSPEAKARLSKLMEPRDAPILRSPRGLRLHRVVRILDQIGGEQAAEILEALARGASERVTLEARESLRRLKGR